MPQFALLLSLVLAVPLWAQQLTAPARADTNDCLYEGTVVNLVTSEPIARARVLLLGSNGQTSVTTDSIGRFRFAKAGCSRAQFVVSRPGFLQRNLGLADLGQPRRNYTLEAGGAASDIRLGLIPQAVVTGVVTDDQGDPVMNAQVMVLNSRIVQGRRSFQGIGNTNTNDLGEFRIPGLMAGKSIVCAQLASGTAFDVGAVGVDQKCYPGPPDGGLASTFDLIAGREVRIPITLPQTAAVNIRGAVSGLPKSRGVAVALMRRGNATMSQTRNANVNPDVDHPRWTQSRERRIGEFRRRETLMFNGYAEQVASLYRGMDLRSSF